MPRRNLVISHPSKLNKKINRNICVLTTIKTININRDYDAWLCHCNNYLANTSE